MDNLVKDYYRKIFSVAVILWLDTYSQSVIERKKHRRFDLNRNRSVKRSAVDAAENLLQDYR